jgi:hypothetical protein
MVKFSLSKAFPHAALLLASLAGVSRAQFTVVSPSSDAWWVAQSTNMIKWSPCMDTADPTVTDFTVLINSSTLTQPMAIIAVEAIADCSILVSQDQANQPAGTGYTILLANEVNNSDIFATSQPFEIKPLGSAYPTQPPTANGTASGGPSPTATTSTAKPTSKAASNKVMHVGVTIALVMGVISLML